jgi:hypothetical protein
MSLIKRDNYVVTRRLNPDVTKAFDHIVITGDYADDLVDEGCMIIKRETAAELQLVTPETGLAFGFAGDGTNATDTVWLYVNGGWLAFDGS